MPVLLRRAVGDGVTRSSGSLQPNVVSTLQAT
jgi:hypothetical protein